MEFNRITLAFSDEDRLREQRFLQAYILKSMGHIRYALIMGAVLIGVFGILDAYLMPAQKHLPWFIRFAVLCPLTFLGVLVTYSRRAVRLIPLVEVVILIATGAGFTAMIIFSPAPVNFLYYTGLIQALIYGHTFIRLRFVWSTLAGWVIIVIYTIAATGYTDIPAAILINNLFFLVSSNFIGMMASYSIEYYARRDFFLAEQLQQRQEEIQTANKVLETRVLDRTLELKKLNEGLQSEIADRKVAEKELRASEDRFRQLFNNAVLGFYRTTPDGSILLANPALCRMLGFSSEEELKTRNLEKDGFHPGYERSAFREELESVGSIAGRETTWTRSDGSSVFIRENARVVRGENNEVLYYEGTIENVTERKASEDSMRASLREKELLLKEIHHRVKNNMQVISSLLNLQMHSVKDPETKEMFRESTRRIRTMALVHEKLYRSEDMAKIDFHQYLHAVTTDLLRSSDNGKISSSVNGEKLLLGIDTAIPCGLIVNELVMNSMKHAFPHQREGIVEVNIRRSGGKMIELSVHDNGVGFPPEIDLERTSSMGLSIVTALTHQISGTIQLDRDSGTTFRLMFPEDQGN